MLVAHDSRCVETAPQPGRREDVGRIRSRELSEITVLVTAVGAIDAASAPDLCTAIERRAAGYRQLVLDLSGVDFFGTAGYSLLHRLRMRCDRAAVDWVLVAGPEVQRLLRVCDPDALLPTAANIVSAVAALARRPHLITTLRNGLR